MPSGASVCLSVSSSRPRGTVVGWFVREGARGDEEARGDDDEGRRRN